MMIPKEKIEEVKDRAGIVQVISEYLPLQKRGHNHIGLCPFHSEKTPSFTVSDEKKIFHCFGCGETGSVITFVMKKEGIAFPEAVRSLAKRYGVMIPDARQGGAPDPRDLLYLALKASAGYFLNEFKGAGGKAALSYLEKRGYSGAEVINGFGLGFAPERWEGLTNYLRKKGVHLESAEKAGVIIKKEKGYYDRFRGRLIFPITDARGRIIGFGGRTLGSGEPKYLNSPETPVFKKGENLYGLFQAKQNIISAGSVIVVEGYFDLIALHSHGFKNSVATMGTALTAEHLKLLKGLAPLVYVLFDSDEAGKKAAARSLDIFLEGEVPCRAVLLPVGKDPDEFLSKEGPGAMKEALSKAAPLVEFCLNEFRKKTDISRPEGKSAYLNKALEYITRVKNVAERDHYAAFAAATLGIPVSSVYEALKNTQKPGMAASAVKGAIQARSSNNLKELTILKVILKFPELYDDKIEAGIEAFSDPLLKEAGRTIAKWLREGKRLDAEALIEAAGTEEVRNSIAGLLFKEDDGFIEAPEKMLEDSLKRLLNKGKIKTTTEEMIRKLEETGRTEVARDIKKRVETARKERH